MRAKGKKKDTTCRVPTKSVNELDGEFAVFVEQFAINMDGAVVAHVADHVPMDSAAVFAAGFGVAHANGHVNCAADFFIEENVARKFVDAEICPDGELAQI